MPRKSLPQSLGARLVQRAISLRRNRPDLAPIQVLDRVFGPHRGESLGRGEIGFEDEDNEPFHPRFGRAFPVILARAFTPAMSRAAWRRALVDAEARDDLEAEGDLLSRWHQEVVKPFAGRYQFDPDSLF